MTLTSNTRSGYPRSHPNLSLTQLQLNCNLLNLLPPKNLVCHLSGCPVAQRTAGRHYFLNRLCYQEPAIMPPLRKRESKAPDMIEINLRATPSSDNIEMPAVTHSVYGQYRNFPRSHTGDYSNISSSTLNVDSPHTPKMSSAHLPPFIPSTGPPSYQSSPVPTRSSSPYPGAHSPFVSPESHHTYHGNTNASHREVKTHYDLSFPTVQTLKLSSTATGFGKAKSPNFIIVTTESSLPDGRGSYTIWHRFWQ